MAQPLNLYVHLVPNTTRSVEEIIKVTLKEDSLVHDLLK